MGDADNSLQSSKKRAAGVQLSRDNPGLDDDNEEASEQDAGTFKRATEEVLATRRIVKVRRQQALSIPSAASDPPLPSNSFSGVCLVPPAPTPTPSGVISKEGVKTDRNNSKSENVTNETKGETSADVEPPEGKVDELKVASDSNKDKNDVVGLPNITELVDGKVEENNQSETVKADNNENAEDTEDKKVDEEIGNGQATTEKKPEPTTSFSSFRHLSSTQNAFSGLAQTGLSNTSFTFGSLPQDRPALGSVRTSLSMQEVPVETGEENESAVFTCESVLYEFINGAWKERGKGELKVNVSTSGTGKARVIMRARGNYRLILNASLFPEMKLTNMDKKGITFACLNTAGEGKHGLSTIALKFKDASTAEDFRAAVLEHKGKGGIGVALKTPENSPQRSDDDEL